MVPAGAEGRSDGAGDMGAAGVVSEPDTSKNIVVCCDGSWCGEATGTNTNVKILASAFVGATKNIEFSERYNPKTDTWVAYYDGVGVARMDDVENTSIEDYFLNGALALDIHVKCIEAYKFIVDHFQEGSQVWLFGLSRGAYTARCVAGMIHNCGVLKKEMIPQDLGPMDFPNLVAAETSGADERLTSVWVACEEVYRIYRDTDRAYKPSGEFAKDFRTTKSWERKQPVVRFLGLFDTVGALGVPEVSAGMHMAYNGPQKLYDQNVAWEVQTVCQALALHDRMAPFTPCFVRRKLLEPPRQPRYSHVNYETEEVWFPGSHYDIGRQRFVLFRTTGRLWERIGRFFTGIFNILHLNINYTPELSNAPLEWIIKRCQDADDRLLPGSVAYYINRFATPTDEHPPWTWFIFPPLTIDAYDHAVENALRLPRLFLDHTHVLQGLVAGLKGLVHKQLLADRHIPLYLGPNGDKSSQYIQHPRLVFGVMHETDLYKYVSFPENYRSRTYQRWKSVCSVDVSDPAVWNRLRLHLEPQQQQPQQQGPAAGAGGAQVLPPAAD